MKDKVLKAELITAAEHIARALRNYSNTTMSCRIYVETRMSSRNGGDAYGIRCRQKNPHVQIIEVANEIQYREDIDGVELIVRTEAVNDTQGRA